MTNVSTVLTVLLSVYGLGASLFVISENRRPQATMAWILAFVFLPVIGVVVYVLFGRSEKAFSKRRKLLLQTLAPNATPLLSPILSRQDAEINVLKATVPVAES